jgi:short-subunit dehydrogenase involved in D-alanine esterification of teichoic acids
VDFTDPASITLSNLDDEVRTNYLAVVHMITHFLPFLISKNPSPAGIVMVSSGLSLVPQPQTANYCASKAAVHSLAWSLRAQLDGSRKRERKTDHIKVVEVIPPAVKTELHARQGRSEFGMELEDYVRDTWGQLAGEADVAEILPAPSRQQGLDRVEDGKRKFFEGFRRSV